MVQFHHELHERGMNIPTFPISWIASWCLQTWATLIGEYKSADTPFQWKVFTFKSLKPVDVSNPAPANVWKKPLGHLTLFGADHFCIKIAVQLIGLLLFHKLIGVQKRSVSCLGAPEINFHHFPVFLKQDKITSSSQRQGWWTQQRFKPTLAIRSSVNTCKHQNPAFQDQRPWGVHFWRQWWISCDNFFRNSRESSIDRYSNFKFHRSMDEIHMELLSFGLSWSQQSGISDLLYHFIWLVSGLSGLEPNPQNLSRFPFQNFTED